MVRTARGTLQRVCIECSKQWARDYWRRHHPNEEAEEKRMDEQSRQWLERMDA